MGKRRAAVLGSVYILMGLHLLHWKLTGRTISPVEPSESMYAIEQGFINAGVIFFALAILATLVFGRFVCGWGCHIVALQDLCGWMMKKIGVRPKPFRSRLLAYFPLALGLYMFVWPTFKRLAVAPLVSSLGWDAATRTLGGANSFPGFTNQLMTNDFWGTFAAIPIAIPFLLVTGFATVYFLGAKGFCTYGCPYGGFFAPIEQLAPGRILVDHDKCKQCGHCTAVCTSNVRVHEEIREYGMVVDSGCMKCMDCVSVCPNDALSFGFAKPAIAKGKPKNKKPKRVYDLSWREEIVLAIVFLASFFAWRGLYGLIPMLMAAGVAGVVTFLAWKMWRMMASRDVRIIGAQLKRAGRIKSAGAVFALFAGLTVLLTAHSLAVRIIRWRGDLIDAQVTVARDAAFSNDSDAVPDDMKTLAGKALANYRWAASWPHGGIALVDTPAVQARSAWLHLVRGERAEALAILARLDDRFGPTDARAVDRATILAFEGDEDKAIQYLEHSLAIKPGMPGSRSLLVSAYLAQGDDDDALRVRRSAIDPDDPDHRRLGANRAQLAALLLQLNRTAEALDELKQAVVLSPKDSSIHSDLAVVLYLTDHPDSAVDEMRQAVTLSPKDPLVRIRLAQLLTQLGRSAEAQRAYDEARALDPSLFTKAP